MMQSQQGDDQQINQLAQKDASQRAQEAMLRMGRDLQAQGHVNEAMDMFVKLLEDYPDTPAANAAANALVDLAEYLEQNGAPHQALNVYRKLEQFQ
jgi:tetratricopeptide (TPR) repeat protein